MLVRILLALASILLLATPFGPPAGTAGAGVVVESVAPGSAGAAAGLRPGDVVVAAGGRVRSPYDLLPVEIEDAPRRAVTLRGRRGREARAWTLRPGDWGIGWRPDLPADLAALYREGKAGAEAGDPAAAGRSWRSAAQAARTIEDGRLAAWFLDRLAGALAEAEMWPEADAAYRRALAALEREADRPAASHLLRAWGGTFERRGDSDAAVERFERALALDRSTAAKSLAMAQTLSSLGVATAKRGRYDDAGKLLREALAIREELAPGTLEVAGSLNKLGVLARLRGDLDAAQEYLTRGEELQGRLAPGTVAHALFFMNLGNVAVDRGDPKRAERLHRRSLAIVERIDAEPGLIAGCLQNLANVAIQRGDLATADDLLHRMLAVRESLAPDEIEVWRVRVNLGHLAGLRQDLETAETHYRLALALAEKRVPEGREVTLSLRGLGELAIARGDFATARTSLLRARQIEERRAPDSIDTAEILGYLARLEVASGGSLATAEGLLRRALAIFEQAESGSQDVASVLRDLGQVAGRRGRPHEALALHRRALEVQGRLAPGSLGEAEALHLLGRAERQAGQTRAGIRDQCRAVDVLESQRARLGGAAAAKTTFEASLGDYYRACLEGRIELGQPAAAFHVLERGRARSFLALLAQRDLSLSALPELAAERRRADAEYDRVQSRLAALNAGRDGAEAERLTAELRGLRARQEEISARMRRESPGSAALEDPEPLDLAGARAALDPGTVLLEYAVGREAAWLFVVEPAAAGGSGLAVYRIGMGAQSLRREVEGLRLLLKDPGSADADLHARGRRLYDLLVRPAEARIAGARRILVSADGPLHTLAFAALRRGDHYLVEWKPVHGVLSATVYAELVKARRRRLEAGEERLVAFGDPVYRPAAPDTSADPEVREAVRRGLALRPLPLSGQEVRSIARLYPQARVHLGSAATEERAKSIGLEPRLVHFACHGLLDERFPLNSALALTLPGRGAEGRDNGLLQAWEIFDGVRLNADLVTLSACDTALGQEMGGEGLVGLTRAFQYAGARSVLASLWGVADRSTARLMERFYSHLRGGKTKDEALRAAQVEQIRDREGASHPFHWAAFQLTGDWR